MEVTYGTGDLTIDSSVDSLKIKYSGRINITYKSEGIKITGSRNVLIIEKDSSLLPGLILKYTGRFIIEYAQATVFGSKKAITSKAIGLDFWKDDETKWHFDGGLWSDRHTNYNVCMLSKYNPDQFDKIFEREKKINTKITSNLNKQIKGGY